MESPLIHGPRVYSGPMVAGLTLYESIERYHPGLLEEIGMNEQLKQKPHETSHQ